MTLDTLRTPKLPVSSIPTLIQGGMGFVVSNWNLARTVSMTGQLGVVSGIALDVIIGRRLQDGDPDGIVRRALATFPDQDMVSRLLARWFLEGGRKEGAPYKPIPFLSLTPTQVNVDLCVLGAYCEIWLAKEGHSGLVGLNLMEKVQVSTPLALLGAMLAGVDAVLVGAGVPREIPALLDALVNGDEVVSMSTDVVGAAPGEFPLEIRPREIMEGHLPRLERPVFLAIVSSHTLASYLARDETIAPDGFVVELPSAGGHNAPPRQNVVTEDGQTVFGPRDQPDLVKVAATGLPFWLAGGAGSPEGVTHALEVGASGVQVGSPFALSRESGLRPDLKKQMLELLRAGQLTVRTDALASPTGFPFKVAMVPGTLSDEDVFQNRPRLCDQGYLRTPYRKDDGKIGYRCAAEPEHMYVKKGGALEDTVGRKCVCNGLSASAGYPQVRAGGFVEPNFFTLGSDLEVVSAVSALHPDGWSAVDVVNYILPKLVLHQGL